MPRTRRWTSADIPDQTGRTFVVTGANAGIGLATTAALTGSGARVIMACRNPDKAEAARATLPAASRDLARVRRLDLADLDSVAGRRGGGGKVGWVCGGACLCQLRGKKVGWVGGAVVCRGQ